MSNLNQQLMQQQHGAGQNLPGQNPMINHISQTVNHLHASDKQSGTKPNNDNLSVAASQNAENVKMKQRHEHEVRLKKLNERLHLLKYVFQCNAFDPSLGRVLS